MITWEYHILRATNETVSAVCKELNDLGLIGWELIAATLDSGSDPPVETFYFKRNVGRAA